MRIVLVISSLRRGGAERIASIMANHWTAGGHQVFLVTIEGKHTDAYVLHPQVTRIALNLARLSGNPVRGFWNNLRRLWRLRAAAHHLRPDVVVSLMVHTNLLVLIALFGGGVPVIVSERVDPSQLALGAIRNQLRKLMYPRAAAVVVQTERVREAMQQRLPRAAFTVIPNPVPAIDPDREYAHSPLRERLGLPAGIKLVSAMGRMGLEKGFDLLIEAFSRVHAAYPDWHLVIFGEGAERPALENLIVRLELSGRVYMPGQVQAARRCLEETDLFVLSSRFEGFPNALLEAMACGLPVVSFDCPSGPREIVRDGQDGLLVEAGNVAALGSAMSTLMEWPARREEFGRNAREVLERYSADRIMALWGQLLSRQVHLDS